MQAERPKHIAGSSIKESKEMAIFQERAKFLMDGCYRSWIDGSYTDIKIIVGKQTFSAHRLVLASLSDYFKPLFELDGNMNGEITLHDLDEDDFTVLLHYAYTGQLDLTKDQVQNVLIAADYLSIDSVKTLCEKFMMDNIDSDNVTDALQFAVTYSLPSLLEGAYSHLRKNLAEVSSAKGFLSMDPEFLIKFFSDDNLVLSSEGSMLCSVEREKLIFKAALRYLSGREDIHCATAETLLGTVRLISIPEKDIKEILKGFKSVKKSEGMKKFLNLRDAAVKYLRRRNSDESLVTQMGGKEAAEIPDAWFRQRKYGQWQVRESSRRYAAGGQVGRSDNPPGKLITGPEYELEQIEVWIRRWDGRPVIGGLRLTYRNESKKLKGNANGLQYSKGLCCGDNEQDYYSAMLEPGEYIIKTTLGSGWLIDSLGFKTNTGRTIGPFGGPGGGDHMEEAPDATLAYLYDINCDDVITQGFPAIYNLMFRWITFD